MMLRRIFCANSAWLGPEFALLLELEVVVHRDTSESGQCSPCGDTPLHVNIIKLLPPALKWLTSYRCGNSSTRPTPARAVSRARFSAAMLVVIEPRCASISTACTALSDRSCAFAPTLQKQNGLCVSISSACTALSDRTFAFALMQQKQNGLWTPTENANTTPKLLIK